MPAPPFFPYAFIFESVIVMLPMSASLPEPMPAIGYAYLSFLSAVAIEAVSVASARMFEFVMLMDLMSPPFHAAPPIEHPDECTLSSSIVDTFPP